MADPDKPKILIQLDPDQHPSVFDSIVAVDSQVDHLLSFGDVEPLDVRDLVHGAMFTRGGASLRHTAIFIGGSSVHSGEQILRAVVDSFFGDVRVSVMLDANGANTTAAAAVINLEKHLPLPAARITVLAATGSVGRRVSWLLARGGAAVRIASRSLERASSVCEELLERDSGLDVTPVLTGDPSTRINDEALQDVDGLVAAGAAGVQLVPSGRLADLSRLKIALDLNAVPPAGVGDIRPADAGRQPNHTALYGAIGVGNLKMKIHRQCIQTLFQSNDQVLDIEEIYAIGKSVSG